MNQVEFKVTSDLAPFGEMRIDANFDECEKWLKESLSVYENMVVTEDNLPEAKSVMAKIRKTKDGIEMYRKEMKKIALSVYTPFEEKAKVLTMLCDASVTNIGEKVKFYDDERKNKKISLLKDYFEEKSTDVKDFIAFETVFNQKWENITYTDIAAKQDIDVAIQKTTLEVKAIKALKSPFEDALFSLYKDGRDLDWLLKYDDTLRERVKNKPEQDDKKDEAVKTESKQSVSEEKDNGLQTVAFRVTGTKEQIMALKIALKEIGLKPERV